MPTTLYTILSASLLETLLLISIVSLATLLLGTLLGVLLFATQEQAIAKNTVIFTLLNALINAIRAVPFVILLIIMLPLTAVLMGTILGFKAAIPALIVAVVPFFARLVYLSLHEVPKGILEAMQAMGLSRKYMLLLLIKEARSSLIASFTVTVVTMIGFIAAAAVIGTGGLGATAYVQGFQRNNLPLMYGATFLMILLVFLVQFIGDKITHHFNKQRS